MDNLFCNIPFVLSLLNEDYNYRNNKKNKKELSTQFTDLKFQNRAPNTSFFLFHKDFTVVSYKPNLNNLVTLISTEH